MTRVNRPSQCSFTWHFGRARDRAWITGAVERELPKLERAIHEVIDRFVRKELTHD